MHSLNRRVFSTGSLALGCAAVLPNRARAADFSLKFGTTEPLGTPLTVRALEAFDRIRKQSGGKVDIQLFPGNSLGGLTSMLAQLRTGAIAFVPIDGITLSAVVPVAAIAGVGFAFKDIAGGFAAFDGELGSYVRKEILAKNIWAFERMMLIGMRQITSNPRPILAPDDLRGLKIRTPPGRLSVDLMRTFGASPVAMDSAEAYTSLQTHLIDGEENGILLVEIDRLFEVQKYLSLTSHQWSGFWLCGNMETWNAIPAPLQDIISKNFQIYAAQQRHDVALLSASVTDKLGRRGMTVGHPDVAPFHARLATFYQRWHAEFGNTAWTALEKYAGKLE